jgi:hypothetical protein
MKKLIRRKTYTEEIANSTGPAVPGTGDDAQAFPKGEPLKRYKKKTEKEQQDVSDDISLLRRATPMMEEADKTGDYKTGTFAGSTTFVVPSNIFRQYNYTNTGKNTDIISFQFTLRTTFISTPGTLGSSSVSNTLPHQPVTSGSGTKDSSGAMIQQAINNPYDGIVVTLGITGDPGYFPGGLGGSSEFDQGDVIIKITMQNLDDYPTDEKITGNTLSANEPRLTGYYRNRS